MTPAYDRLSYIGRSDRLKGSIVVMTWDLLQETQSFEKVQCITCWTGRRPNHHTWDYQLSDTLAKELAAGKQLIGLATGLQMAGSYWWLTFMMPERKDITNDACEVQFTLETEKVPLALPYIDWKAVPCSRWL